MFGLESVQAASSIRAVIRGRMGFSFGRGYFDAGGFAFEVQLSITEKGQYAVAYGLSCKKDCHELHATDPRRTIPHPIPVPPLHHRRNRQTA